MSSLGLNGARLRWLSYLTLPLLRLYEQFGLVLQSLGRWAMSEIMLLANTSCLRGPKMIFVFPIHQAAHLTPCSRAVPIGDGFGDDAIFG